MNNEKWIKLITSEPELSIDCGSRPDIDEFMKGAEMKQADIDELLSFHTAALMFPVEGVEPDNMLETLVSLMSENVELKEQAIENGKRIREMCNKLNKALADNNETL